MAKTINYDDGLGELRMETEQIEVTSLAMRPDPKWRYTDQQGHEHYWQDNDLPTLVRVIDQTYWCAECHDEHTESHMECVTCGETIVPDMVPPPPWREYVPGRRSYFLNDEPISEERAIEIMNARRRP